MRDGLYPEGKFRVERLDGESSPGGRHEGCQYFVLDVDHDVHARAALRAYARSCVLTLPRLADDLLRLADRPLKAKAAKAVSPDPNSTRWPPSMTEERLRLARADVTAERMESQPFNPDIARALAIACGEGVEEPAEAEDDEDEEPPELCVCGHRQDRHGVDVFNYPCSAEDCDCQGYDSGEDDAPPEGGRQP